MKVLFFDTETTGFYSKSLSHTDEKQVKMVQLGALLCDDQGHTAAELNVMVYPERSTSDVTYNFTVPEAASAIHGITTERAKTFGVTQKIAMMAFSQLVKSCSFVVAHNFDYDDKIMEVENSFTDINWWPISRDPDRTTICTMKSLTDVIKIPSTRGGFKWPKLQEAYKHYFGKEFECAHDAMADVRACRDVFYEAVKRGDITIPTKA